MAISGDRKQISKQIKHQFDFSNCAGCMDRTLNLLTFEPQCWDASDYSGRKYGYSLSTTMMTSEGSHITWLDSQGAHMTIISSRIQIYFETSIPILANMNTCLELWLLNVSHLSLGHIDQLWDN